MKKIFFLLGIVAVMASCGTQTAKTEEAEVAIEATEAVVDSAAAVADTVEVMVADTVVAQ